MFDNTVSRNNFTLNSLRDLGATITPVRVTYILLDDSNKEKFEKYGGWNGLGTIEYIDLNQTKKESNQSALPLNPNSKIYPLVNEVVYILSLPNTSMGDNSNKISSYYINIIGLWNHPHHNAYPSNANEPNPSQQKNYLETTLGSVSIVTDNAKQIRLGNTFEERSNIHTLLPFEGDVIHEGRWGNSIRLGSTVKNTQTYQPVNVWSTGESTNGDPIIIIRNGQGDDSPEGWMPTVEDINTDLSSIYIASTQKIPLEVESKEYGSYSNSGYTEPSDPKIYAGKQIILNSGRLVFNTTEDHLLLSSAKSISLNSLESVNIDTNKFITSAEQILLGPTSQATEPLLLGDSTAQFLRELTKTLKTLNKTLVTLINSPTTPLGSPIAPTLGPELSKMAISLILLEKKLGTKETCTLTSKNNFTR